MTPFAAANRVRLIHVNRRDYPGSTPLSDSELVALGSTNLETRAKALAQQGTDIGLFLAWLVREEKIPAMSVDRSGKQQGGIVLVAWSLAHTPLAGFLAHADTLPVDAIWALEPCLRAYCIFGKHPSFSRLSLAWAMDGRPPCQRSRLDRRAARLVRPSDAQQVPPARRRDVPDGAARAALLLVGLDVLHALGSRAQDAQPRAPGHHAAAVPGPAVCAPRDARCHRACDARGRLVAWPHPGLRGAVARHAAGPRARADAPDAAGPGGRPHAPAMQGRRGVGREHALGDGGRRVGCREAVQGTQSDRSGGPRARGRGDARGESLRTFIQKFPARGVRVFCG